MSVCVCVCVCVGGQNLGHYRGLVAEYLHAAHKHIKI